MNHPFLLESVQPSASGFVPPVISQGGLNTSVMGSSPLCLLPWDLQGTPVNLQRILFPGMILPPLGFLLLGIWHPFLTSGLYWPLEPTIQLFKHHFSSSENLPSPAPGGSLPISFSFTSNTNHSSCSSASISPILSLPSGLSLTCSVFFLSSLHRPGTKCSLLTGLWALHSTTISSLLDSSCFPSLSSITSVLTNFISPISLMRHPAVSLAEGRAGLHLYRPTGSVRHKLP